MLYGEKLKHHLKTEKNPINKMYLNELIINWNKVEVALQETNDSPISAMVSAISTYTKYLYTPKFKYSSVKKCGFSDDHDVFKVHYLYDIIEKILNQVGVRDEKKGMFIDYTTFHTGLSLERDTFKKQCVDPNLDIHSSSKYFYVGIELDVQYRLATQKKAMSKAKINIPLIVFYIEKVFTERCFANIRELRKDMVKMNPNAKLLCITESYDKKHLVNYSEIEDILYVVRCHYKNDEYKDLQPQVFLALYKKIDNIINNENYTFDVVAQFGHVDLVNKAMIITDKGDKNEE